MEGRENGGENHVSSEASPICLDAKTEYFPSVRDHRLEYVTFTHKMKLTKHFNMTTNHAPYIPNVDLLIIEKPRW